jgi:hypothetical protein
MNAGTRRFYAVIIIGILFTLIFPAADTNAATVLVGDSSIDIPTPIGFSLLTPHMRQLYDFQQKLVRPGATQLAALIPEEKVPAALGGEIPDLPRRLVVLLGQHDAKDNVSQSEFSEFRRETRTTNEQAIRKSEEKIPGLVEQLNHNLRDYNLAVSGLDVVVLPLHYETDSAIAFSMVYRYQESESAGDAVSPRIGVGTTTLVHVKGKLLQLNCYGDKDDLKWSRDVARQWTEAILAANQLADRSGVSDATVLQGIDWDKILSRSMASATVVLVLALGGWLRGRVRRRA